MYKPINAIFAILSNQPKSAEIKVGQFNLIAIEHTETIHTFFNDILNNEDLR